MSIRVDKSQSNESRAAENVASEGKDEFQFSDQRSDAITQRKLADTANDGAGARQLRAFQEMADDSPQSHPGAAPVQRKFGYNTEQGDYFIGPWKTVYSVSPFLKELESHPHITLNIIADRNLPSAHGTTQLVFGGTKPKEPVEWYQYLMGEPTIELRIGPNEDEKALLQTMLHECYLHVFPKYAFLKEGRRLMEAIDKADGDEQEQERLFAEFEKLFDGKEEHKDVDAWFTLLLAAYDMGCFDIAVLDCCWDYHLGVKKAVELESAVKQRKAPVQVIEVQDVFQYSEEQLRLLMEINGRVIEFKKGGTL